MKNWRDRFDEKFADKQVGFSCDFGDYKTFEDEGIYDSVIDFIKSEIEKVKKIATDNQIQLELYHETQLDSIACMSVAQLISWSEARKIFAKGKLSNESVQKLKTIISLGSSRLHVTKPCDYCEGMGTRTVSVEQDNGYGEIQQEECSKCKGEGLL
jgi:hypothetical protein